MDASAAHGHVFEVRTAADTVFIGPDTDIVKGYDFNTWLKEV